MHINQDNYRQFPAIANSDLTWLQKYWMPSDRIIDLEKAYKEGNLIDAMITEPQRVNYFKKLVDDVQYSDEQFLMGEEMKKAFYRDDYCAKMVKHCSFQRISYNPAFKIQHDDFEITVPAKAKWDLFCEKFDMGGDIKSTACTTQKQCEEAVRHFCYDRSRAWYMDLEGRSNDMLIFISKKNYKVFKVPVPREGSIYKQGKAAYQELAFRYWYLFCDINNSKREVMQRLASGAHIPGDAGSIPAFATNF